MAEVQPIQLSQFVQTQNAADKEPEKVQEKPKLTTPQKVMVGAAILGATIAAGLGIRHGIKVKNFNDAYEKLFGQLNSTIERLKNDDYPEWFNYEELALRARKASTNAKQAGSLTDVEFYEQLIRKSSSMFGLRKSALKNLGDKIDINKFDAHIKNVLEKVEKNKALNEIDQLNAELIESRCFANPSQKNAYQIIDKDYFKTLEKIAEENRVRAEEIMKANSTIGKTVAESVENTFGKNSGIIPHTYDLTKECDQIGIQVYYGGYKPNIAFKPNANNSELDKALSTCMFKGNGDSLSILSRQKYQNGVSIAQVECQGRKFVRMNFPIGSRSVVDNTDDQLVLASMNSKLTPAQQDLIKIAENLTEKDIDNLCKAVGQPYGKYGEEYVYRKNYDALLSLIQTIANRA